MVTIHALEMFHMMSVDRHTGSVQRHRYKYAGDLPRTNHKDSNHNGFEVILQLQLQDEWNGQNKYGKISDDAHDTGNDG